MLITSKQPLLGDEEHNRIERIGECESLGAEREIDASVGRRRGRWLFRDTREIPLSLDE
jgi:hypothetical protein